MPRPRRPIESYEPGQLATLNFRVPIETRGRIQRRAEAAGTSMLDQTKQLIEWALDHQDWLGGPRVVHLLMVLAEIARLLYPDGDWLDDAEKFSEVAAAWAEAVANRAPPPKITIAERIACGRGLVVQLLATRDPRRADHLRQLLRTMSRVTAFPPEIQAEFSTAANAVPPEVVHQSPPAPPSSPDRTATALDHFNSGWLIARAILVGRSGSEPDDAAIAEAIIADDELRSHAGLRGFTAAEEVLARRAEFLASAEEPVIEAEPLEVDRIQGMIERGRRLIASLDDARYPRRAAAIRDLLGIMSREPGLPDEIAGEFAAAAARAPPEGASRPPVNRSPEDRQ